MTISPTTSTAVPTLPRKRKAHTKSRRGCSSCKTRRVKCDERKPMCQQCKGTSLIVTTLLQQPYLLPHPCRVWCILRIWRQSNWLDLCGRELFQPQRYSFRGFISSRYDGYCSGEACLGFFGLPTTKPIIHDRCTLQ
jgi:hypothetical protein